MLHKLFYTLLCVAVANGTGKQVFCTSRETAESLRGLRGDAGSIGPNGLTGRDGESAVVDYERIYENLDEKLSTALDNFQVMFDSKVDYFEQLIESLETTAEPATTAATLPPEEQKVARLRAKGLCTVQHENICFWAEVHIRQDIYESTATNICQKDGGEVGNIYSRQHYDDVMALIRSVIPEGMSVSDPARTWTAMKVKPNGDATLSDDSPAPYVKWLASWYPSQGQTGIMLSVPIDPKAYYQGMTDIVPTRNAYGVLCQL